MDDLSNITAQHLALLKSLTTAFWFWILFGTLNVFASICIIYISIVWKPMQRDTMLLVLEMSIMELIGGLINASTGAFHIHMSLSDQAESRSAFECWLIVSWDILTASVIVVIYFELSFDRFYAAIFPAKYKNRSKYCAYCLLVLPWLFGILIFFLSLNAVLTNNTLTSICIPRFAVNLSFFTGYSCSMIGISVLAYVMYIVVVVLLKFQVRKVARTGGNVAEVKQRLNNKVTKSMAVSALAHLLTFSTASSGTLIVTYFAPLQGAPYGPYFYMFYHFGSITCLPIFYFFQEKFHQGVNTTFKKLCLCKSHFSHNAIVPATRTTHN